MESSPEPTSVIKLALILVFAGSGLMVGGYVAWKWLDGCRSAARRLLYAFPEDDLVESELKTFTGFLQHGLNTFTVGGVSWGLCWWWLLDRSWGEPNWITNGLLAGLGFGAGAAVVGVVITGVLIFARTRYRIMRKFRREVIGSLGEDKLKHVDVARQAKRERAEFLLERNLGATFVIKQLVFSNVGIFKELSWQPSPGINVMLGRNGYGKSYLLRLMVGLLSYDNDRLAELVGNMGRGFNMSLKLLRDDKPVEIEHDGTAFDESTGKVPLLAIPDSRFINRAEGSVAAEGGKYEADGDSSADLARHGAHHFLYDRPFDATIQMVLAEMCIQAIGVRGMKKRRSIEYPESPQLKLIEDVMYALSGDKFRFRRISAIGGARFAIMLDTEASPGQPISIQKASQGTLSVIAIFGLVYQYLRKLYSDVPERRLCEQKAIVLIDEVDAHLHPVWQRKIVHLLRQRFPNIQFILTAHSPLVVAGCSYGEVSVLKWVGESLQVVEFQHDFVGTSVDDIYRDIFDVGERDETFLQYYAQLPIVRDLEKELTALRSEPNVDQERIDRAEEELSLIKRTHKKEEEDLQLEALQRENEQLKRQLSAARRSEQ